MANKGFIKDWRGNQLLPITRGELVLDVDGNIALNSDHFLAKDGHPGLITAAERAMLSGGSEGGNITDLYNKIGYINTGLKFNGTALNFYNASAQATPINITSTGDNKIDIAVNGQTVTLGLTALSTQSTSVSQILRSITVDKWGRVTAVSGSNLTNADIPAELTGKTLKNGILNNCTTSTVDIDETNNQAIANKAYVDKKIQAVTGMATGALKFGGSLADATSATSKLNKTEYFNHYYKVTAANGFTIPAEYLYSETESTTSDKKVKVGDTLIIYPTNTSTSNPESKYVHVPSGDDITTITVTEEGAAAAALDGKMGSVTFQFASIFNVTNPVGQTVSIALPQSSASQDGYLSKGDWSKFNDYATNLKVQYSPTVTSSTTGQYTIGTLTIGNTPHIIYGKNNISSLTVNNGASNAYNPILRFTETGSSDYDITLKGLNGVAVLRNDKTVEFRAANETIEQAIPSASGTKVKYITVDSGYKFGVQLGSADSAGNVTQDGLVDYREFNTVANAVTLTTIFEDITYSLKGAASTTEYRYGNDKLKAAIAITTI